MSSSESNSFDGFAIKGASDARNYPGSRYLHKSAWNSVTRELFIFAGTGPSTGKAS